MKKITINVNNKTLTIYVAADALPSDLSPAAQASILQTIADKMFRKFENNEIVYLAKAELPTPQHPDKIRIQYNTLANKENRLLISNVSMSPDENPSPVVIEDLTNQDVSYALPGDLEAAHYRKVLLDKAVTNANVVDDQVLYLTQDPDQTLRELKNEVFADIPETYPGLAELHGFVDRTINQEAAKINRDRKYIQDAIQTAQNSEYAYYAAILPLTAQLYNAAKAYYMDILQKYGSNYAELRKQFLAFNTLYDGIVRVNDDFSISSPNETIEQLRRLNADTLQQRISELVHNAYQQSKVNNALSHLQDKLSSANEYYAVKGSYIPWTWKFEFTPAAKDLYAKYVTAQREVNDLATSGLRNFIESVHTAKAAILDRASHIKQEHKAAIDQHKAELAAQQKARDKQQAEEAKKAAKQQAKAEAAANRNAQGSFWQRNKGTIISIGTGILIGAGAAAAIVFAPIALPILVVGGIAAAVGVAVVGISAIVGRMIDYRRNKKAKDQYADVSSAASERKNLVADSDSDFRNNATTAQLMSQPGFIGPNTAATATTYAEYSSLPLSRSGSLTSLFPPAREDDEYAEMAAFENELVWKIAETFCGKNTGADAELAAVYTTTGHNIDTYIAHVKKQYRNAEGPIRDAIRTVAQAHPNLNTKLFKDSVLEKDYELSKFIGAAGKKDLNPFA